MLTQEQFDDLRQRIELLVCTDANAGEGLFTFVFKGEPEDQARKYRAHLADCEFCRVAVQIYRYQKDVARLLGREQKGRGVALGRRFLSGGQYHA